MKRVVNEVLAGILLLFAGAVGAATQLTENEQRSRQWNTFSDRLIALHRKQINRHRIYEEQRIGGYHGAYFNDPDYYREVSYFDATSRRLLSRVRWIRDEPRKVHTIEVYVYAANGRLERDYLAAYLPWGRKAPVQTLVNLHGYNRKLHSFRQFDASGQLIAEQCGGELNGVAIDISLDDYEIPRRAEEKSPSYRACFDAVGLSAARFIKQPM